MTRNTHKKADSVIQRQALSPCVNHAEECEHDGEEVRERVGQLGDVVRELVVGLLCIAWTRNLIKRVSQ